jgi:hypothetical protein
MLLVRAGDRSVPVVTEAILSGRGSTALIDVLASIGSEAARDALVRVSRVRGTDGRRGGAQGECLVEVLGDSGDRPRALPRCQGLVQRRPDGRGLRVDLPAGAVLARARGRLRADRGGSPPPPADARRRGTRPRTEPEDVVTVARPAPVEHPQYRNRPRPPGTVPVRVLDTTEPKDIGVLTCAPPSGSSPTHDGDGGNAVPVGQRPVRHFPPSLGLQRAHHLVDAGSKCQIQLRHGFDGPGPRHEPHAAVDPLGADVVVEVLLCQPTLRRSGSIHSSGSRTVRLMLRQSPDQFSSSRSLRSSSSGRIRRGWPATAAVHG